MQAKDPLIWKMICAGVYADSLSRYVIVDIGDDWLIRFSDFDGKTHRLGTRPTLAEAKEYADDHWQNV